MLRLELTANGTYDLARDANGVGLSNDGDSRTIMLIALGTDARARPGEAGDEIDPRGWWGDSYPDVPGRVLGGRVWLVEGAKTTAEALAAGETYVREALQFMLDDGLISSLDVVGARVSGDRYLARIVVEPPEGGSGFELLWETTIYGL